MLKITQNYDLIFYSGNLDMLHSLYDFKATYPRTLSFRNNEYFILNQVNMRKKNWWEVINEKGETGYIPSNYVETITVNPSFYLHFVESCLDSLSRNEDCQLSTTDKKKTIKKLNELKKQIEQLPEIQNNTIGSQGDMPPLIFQNSDGQLEMNAESNSSVVKNIEEENSKPIIRKMSSRDNMKKSLENLQDSKSDNLSTQQKKSLTSNCYSISPAITHQTVYDLVESVRINTELSHEMSKIAVGIYTQINQNDHSEYDSLIVGTVIQGLHELLPASVFPYLSTIQSHIETPLVVDDVQIEQTHDASRLRLIFNELTSCKEDSQQRSWMLHEDEGTITEYIKELISILVRSHIQLSLKKYHIK